jgi:hypothetical protein
MTPGGELVGRIARVGRWWRWSTSGKSDKYPDPRGRDSHFPQHPVGTDTKAYGMVKPTDAGVKGFLAD